MTIAIYAGSFDPIHVGHVDVIGRAAQHFDKVFLVLASNPEKNYMFSLEHRLQMIQRVSAQHSNVQWDCWDGLLVDYVINLKARCVNIRGVRNTIDFEYEKTMSDINYDLGLHGTIFYPANLALTHVSSSAIRQLIKLKAPIFSILNMIPSVNQALIQDIIRSKNVH